MTLDKTLAAVAESGRLVAALRAFDRKERPYVVQTCLGLGSKKLDATFLTNVTGALKLNSPLGPESWWTTDHHFDWMAGALALYYEPDLETAKRTFVNEHYVPAFKTEKAAREHASWANLRLITGSQEDADLLIVDGTRIVILEAKRYGAWRPGQVKRKYHRTEHLRHFANKLADERGKPRIDIHLIFSSPRPKGADGMPQALRNIWKDLEPCDGPPWIPLRGAEKCPAAWAYLTSRCNKPVEGKKPVKDKNGTDWFIDTVDAP
jgi:hypothetical protein